LLGAAAGAAATWLMDETTSVLYERQSESSKKRESKARHGKNAYEIVAEKAAKLTGHELSEEQLKLLSEGIHWSMGIGSGIVYGLLRNRIPRLGIGSGVAYGIAFTVLVDEAALTALGVVPPPDAFPWQTHARGVAGHLVLGAVLDAAFDVADLLQPSAAPSPTALRAVDPGRS
jgi:hypothetical protein